MVYQQTGDMQALGELFAAKGKLRNRPKAGKLIKTFPIKNMTQCNIPPEGWYCSREHGHDGPCAAHKIPEYFRYSYITYTKSGFRILKVEEINEQF